MRASLRHLALIMDGNGRWAKEQGLARTKGHEQGAQVVHEVTAFAAKEGIEILTLYAFSTENWKRPKSEVVFLMKLLATFLKQELPKLLEHNVRFETIGDTSAFSTSLQSAIGLAKEKTAHCTGLRQVLALNYGGWDEIARGARKLAEAHSPITSTTLRDSLDITTPVDLLVRTGGEMRLSNFLLWQAAYAELRFTKTLWPAFTCKELQEIIEDFSSTQRRFGGL